MYDNWLFLTLFLFLPIKLKREEEKENELAKLFFSGTNRFLPIVSKGPTQIPNICLRHPV